MRNKLSINNIAIVEKYAVEKKYYNYMILFS